jgi:hypothetical protein
MVVREDPRSSGGIRVWYDKVRAEEQAKTHREYQGAERHRAPIRQAYDPFWSERVRFYDSAARAALHGER